MSFLGVFNEFQTISCEDMNIYEPFLLRGDKGINTKYYNMNNSSKQYLYNSIGIKSKLSNDLYNLDVPIWKSIIDSKYCESDFDFSNYKAIILRGEIIEFINEENSEDLFEDLFNTFILSLKKYEDSGVLVSYFNEFKTMNLIFKKDKAIVIASLDFNNGWYSVHSGLYHDMTYILFPNAEIETNSFNEFIKLFKIDELMNIALAMSVQDVESLGFNFNTSLSLREVFDIIKNIRCLITLDEDNYVASISGMSTENSNIIVEFLNSFGSTFKSLKKLSFLRKVFRTGKLSSGLILKIISEEIGSEALNINGYTLANISKICSTEEFDKKIIEEETRR